MFVTSVLQNTSLPRCGCSLSISWGTELSRKSLRNHLRILDQDGEVRRCRAHKPIKNTSTWGSILIENLLVEGLLYNQGCKKDTSMIGLEGEKVNQVRTYAPEGTQKKGWMHGQTPALRSDWFKLHIGCPDPEVLSGEDKPLEGLLRPEEGLWELGLHLWGAHVWWLAQKVGRREVCPSGWWVSHDCLPPAPAEPRLWSRSLCVTAWHWIWENHNGKRWPWDAGPTWSWTESLLRSPIVSSHLTSGARVECEDRVKHTFPGGSDDKESACNAGDTALIPGLGRSPGEGEKEMATHSSILVWEIPCREEPGGL